MLSLTSAMVTVVVADTVTQRSNPLSPNMLSASTPTANVLSSQAKRRRKIAIALAFAGSLPTPLPLTWLHKFYIGQYLWGIVYLVLAPTMLPKVACCLEGVWYVSQNDETFLTRFPKAGALLGSTETEDDSIKETKQSRAKAEATQKVANALRDLEQLRQDGLITEYEFEQKRRKLLDVV